ncbi:hypothetical protein MKK75_29380 [Methylobacterium sp. J-030]|uniref:hypothetical protein n=1 Tax=Methylobacterium sp. J-030 TaxID=2836627 RepID=UPI001FBBC228|nr:hypothetical protein [Methylobacterium sp. J-030]MCJ2072858.1 hypothetical protein [Methylobacterium sp. J-030]
MNPITAMVSARAVMRALMSMPEAIKARPLLDGFEAGTLDAVIVRSDDDRRAGAVPGPEPFGWFAAPGFVHRAGEPRRPAARAPCCAVRDVALRQLDRAAIPWTEVFAGGTAAIGAALSLVPHAALSDPRTRASLRAVTAAFRTAPRVGCAARMGVPEG